MPSFVSSFIFFSRPSLSQEDGETIDNVENDVETSFFGETDNTEEMTEEETAEEDLADEEETDTNNSQENILTADSLDEEKEEEEEDKAEKKDLTDKAQTPLVGDSPSVIKKRGTYKISHPNAKLGLTRITKEGVYEYKTPTSPQNYSTSVRLGTFSPE